MKHMATTICVRKKVSDVGDAFPNHHIPKQANAIIESWSRSFTQIFTSLLVIHVELF